MTQHTANPMYPSVLTSIYSLVYLNTRSWFLP